MYPFHLGRTLAAVQPYLGGMLAEGTLCSKVNDKLHSYGILVDYNGYQFARGKLYAGSPARGTNSRPQTPTMKGTARNASDGRKRYHFTSRK